MFPGTLRVTPGRSCFFFRVLGRKFFLIYTFLQQIPDCLVQLVQALLVGLQPVMRILKRFASVALLIFKLLDTPSLISLSPP